jgi:DNA-directed RNA polymerase specialized sigma24 family protein
MMSDQRMALETSLFHQYADELLRFLTAKLGCREQAADVVQDTFVRLRGISPWICFAGNKFDPKG